MTLRPHRIPKSPIKVPTLLDIPNGLLDVQFVQPAEERECVDGAVGESGIDFAEGVAGEDA